MSTSYILLLLEPGQVLGELPRRDPLVVPSPLVSFDADEVVDVVLVPPAAEGLAHDVVPLELPRGVQQVRRQQLDAAAPELVLGDVVQVAGIGIAGVDSVLDPVET